MEHKNIPLGEKIAPKKEVKKISKAEAAKKMAAQQEKDNELVYGVFKNYENPGATLVFSYKWYPGEDMKEYELRDGERYRIPRGVAKHLNNNCFYKEYKHLPGEKGDVGMRAAFNDGRLRASNMQMARKVHRFGFQSLEFMDDDLEMNPTDLVEVTVSP